MILIPICAALGALATAVAATSGDDSPRRCAIHPIKVSKLDKCSTARAFCERYLSTSSVVASTITHTKTKTTTTYTSTFAFTTFATGCASSKKRALPTIAVREPSAAMITAPAQVARAADAAKPSCGIDRGANPASISGACECVLQRKTTTTTTTMSSVSAVATAYSCADNIYDSNFLLRVTGTNTTFDGQDLNSYFGNINTATDESTALVWEFQQLPSGDYYLTAVNNGNGNLDCYGALDACEIASDSPTFTCTVDLGTGDLSCVNVNDGSPAPLYLYDGYLFNYDYSSMGGTGELTLQEHTPFD